MSKLLFKNLFKNKKNPQSNGDESKQAGGTTHSPRALQRKDSAGSDVELSRDDSFVDEVAGNHLDVAGDYASDVPLAPEDQRFSILIANEEFSLDPRYKPMKKLGSGAFGVVCAAMDEKTGKKVAIKKIRDVFHNLTDAKRILREVKLLQHMDHPNIIKLNDIINPIKLEDFEHLYLVTEYMQSDLHRIIYSENVLTEEHMAYIMFQILCGLKYLHSANVMHRDLKPSNILVNSDCQVKICDLGLARGVSSKRRDSSQTRRSLTQELASPSSGSDETKNPEDHDVEHSLDGGESQISPSASANSELQEQDSLTEYVVTRWYRAPEVMVSAKKYAYGIDIWSIGCILGEMINKDPVFQGRNYVDQLNVIFNKIGSPTEEDYQCIESPDALAFIRKLSTQRRRPISELFPTASEQAADLLERILVFDPKKRINLDEALKHPFFRKFYDEDYVKKCVHTQPFDFEFEKLTRTKQTIQDLLFQEIVNFRPHAASRNPLRKTSDSRRGSKSSRHASKHKRSITPLN